MSACYRSHLPDARTQEEHQVHIYLGSMWKCGASLTYFYWTYSQDFKASQLGWDIALSVWIFSSLLSVYIEALWLPFSLRGHPFFLTVLMFICIRFHWLYLLPEAPHSLHHMSTIPPWCGILTVLYLMLSPIIGVPLSLTNQCTDISDCTTNIHQIINMFTCWNWNPLFWNVLFKADMEIQPSVLGTDILLFRMHDVC